MPNDFVIPMKKNKSVCLSNVIYDNIIYFILMLLNSKTMFNYMEV